MNDLDKLFEEYMNWPDEEFDIRWDKLTPLQQAQLNERAARFSKDATRQCFPSNDNLIASSDNIHEKMQDRLLEVALSETKK